MSSNVPTTPAAPAYSHRPDLPAIPTIGQPAPTNPTATTATPNASATPGSPEYNAAMIAKAQGSTAIVSGQRFELTAGNGMVANAAGAAGVDATNPQFNPGAHMQERGGSRYNSASGQYESWGNVAESGRIPDDGRDLGTEVAGAAARIDSLKAQLDEVSYHPATGAATPKVEGPARDLLQRQYETAKASAAYDTGRLQAIANQRAADRVRAQAAQNEEAAAIMFAKGDPARAAALKDALIKAEAEETARALVGRRISR